MSDIRNESAAFTRQTYKTSNPYESKFGYARAVKKGPFIFVSGTTSIDPASGIVLHPTSAYDQTLQIFSEIVKAIERLGGGKSDVVRVRMFVTRDEDCADVGRALKEVFGEIEPAATMIVGARFVDTNMRVEIEADAVVS